MQKPWYGACLCGSGSGGRPVPLGQRGADMLKHRIGERAAFYGVGEPIDRCPFRFAKVPIALP